MRKIILTTAVLLTIAPLPAPAADFENGLAAAKAGDWETALNEWQPLAEQGDAAAQYNLGVMFANGHGVPQDYKEAVKWTKLAAEQGHASAQNILGLMFDNGQGVPQDYKEAVKWYRIAAEQGDASAQYNLGRMFDNGQGVPQDYKLAYMWLNLASANGIIAANKVKDILAGKMTKDDIAKAQEISTACLASAYQTCGY